MEKIIVLHFLLSNLGIHAMSRFFGIFVLWAFSRNLFGHLCVWLFLYCLLSGGFWVALSSLLQFQSLWKGVETQRGIGDDPRGGGYLPKHFWENRLPKQVNNRPLSKEDCPFLETFPFESQYFCHFFKKIFLSEPKIFDMVETSAVKRIEISFYPRWFQILCK